VWTIRKLSNDDFGQEYWHFHDTIDHLDDDNCTIDGDNEVNWQSYYHRKPDIDDSWDRYRNYQGLMFSHLLVIL
jgi:hypothetical protein